MKDKLLKIYQNFESTIAGVCLASLTIITVVEVIRRYVFGSPGAYSEELARYLFIYCTFFSMAYAIKENSHIATDIIPECFPRKWSISLNIFVTMVFFAFSLFMLKLGISYVDKMVMFERLTEAMALPMYYFCIAPPLGFAITAFRCVERIWKLFKELRNNELVA